MSSYLRNWIYGQSSVTLQEPEPAVSLSISPPQFDEDVEDDSNTEVGGGRDDDNAPPAFPALSSAQRASTSSPSSLAPPSSPAVSPIPRILSDTHLMPPPSLPASALRVPGAPQPKSSSTSSTLQLPPTTTKPPVPASKRREKVALAPGFGPLDWAHLKSSGVDLRGVDTLLRVTPSMLKEHRTKDDAWSVFNGKVYNITPYLPFHPGGEKELMRVAGRDGTKLFASTHAWVNVDFMLDGCMVGFLVPER